MIKILFRHDILLDTNTDLSFNSLAELHINDEAISYITEIHISGADKGLIEDCFSDFANNGNFTWPLSAVFDSERPLRLFGDIAKMVVANILTNPEIRNGSK